MLILLITALLTGMFFPIQTAANARMRASVGPAFVATFIAFSVSSLVLCGVSLLCGMVILPTAAQISTVPWWGWTGGIIGLCTITATIYLFKALGQLQTIILPLLGQLLFSLVIDHFGLFGSVRIPLSALRVFAMFLLISGVLLVVVVPNLSKNKVGQPAIGSHILLWQITGVVTGCLMASIGAIYGRLGVCLGSAVQASAVSFLIATVIIAAFCVGSGKIHCVRKALSKQTPWWMWLAGVFGAIAVFCNAWLIPQIGAGAFFMALLLGQMSLSLLMEGRGWMGAMKRKITPVQFVGIALMIIGVAMIRL